MSSLVGLIISLFVAIILTTSSVLSRPQEPLAAAPPPHPPAASGSGSTPIPIVSQTEEINPDGSFKFSYETGNGIKFEESGLQKDNGTSPDKIQVIQGSVTYTDNEGKVINLKYIADENGFQPEGDHLPTSPPAPEGIARALKESSDQSSSGPRSEPPAAQHVAQPAAQPVAQPAAHPAAQPVAQTIAQPAAEPAAKPADEPAPQPQAA